MKKLMLIWIAALFIAIPLAKVSAAETITLSFNASKHVKFPRDISRVVVGSDDIVNIKRLPPSNNEFIISAQRNAGTTTLFVWTVDGAEYEYIINVEDSGLSEIIERMINLPDVHVKKVGNKILLSGTVKNQTERNYVLQTARLYVSGSSSSNLNTGSTASIELNAQSSTSSSSGTLGGSNSTQDGGNIIDLLQILNPTKIRFEAQIVEITSDNAKDLGIQYGASGNGGTFYFGESYGSAGVSFRHNPAKWVEQRFGTINATISALVSNGKARILSRPNITTLDGEAATIQVGGEIPYTVVGTDGFATTNFKNYGIILQLKPVVDPEGRITSAIHTEVSNMSGTTINGLPVIATRRADTVMTLDSGATMIIGGLIDSTESKNVSKIPLLGDIPIIGEFFKYTSKRKEKRELIILVTPYIVSDSDTRRADMSDDMREWYNDKKRERNSLGEVDLNEEPPAPEVVEKPKSKSKFRNPNR